MININKETLVCHEDVFEGSTFYQAYLPPLKWREDPGGKAGAEKLRGVGTEEEDEGWNSWALIQHGHR